MTYQPTVPPTVTSTASQESEKRRSVVIEYTPRDIPLTNDTNLNGIASIVNAFNRTSTNGENGNRTSRSSSISSIQPLVSNLIKIYSEATPVKTRRIEDTVSADKHNELIKIFEQATTAQQQVRSTSPMNIKQPTQACDEITWDNLVHG